MCELKKQQMQFENNVLLTENNTLYGYLDMYGTMCKA